MEQDFDLHGVVGIRLVDAEPGDVAKVSRQLGPLRARLTREPDITIRFVDRLETGPLTYVAVGETGFDGDGFYVLQGRGGTPAKALIPFDDVGGTIVITCERAMPAVPHLLACINMTALAQGILPLHASAFEQDGVGVLVMGWAKGGKTEALLGSMDGGAQYIGDEWIYLTPDGQMMGLPEPIRLWAWHLEQQPRVLSARSASERRRLSVWRTLAAGMSVARARGPARGLARRALPILQRQAFLQIPPEDLFGRERFLERGRLDAAVLMLSHASEEIVAERAGPHELSGRMSASLVHERDEFLSHYRHFRFAYPSRRSPVVETAADQEETLLRSLFDDRPAGKVAHPYPCDLAELSAAVAGMVDDLTSQLPVVRT